MNAVIFDCDGTLVDVTGIRHHVLGKKKNYHKFHEESVNCPPNLDVVAAAKAAHAAGLKVLIVMARQDRYMYHTLFWLSGPNVDVDFDGIYMRKTNDNRPDYVVKKEILDKIRQDGYNPIHAYDDNPAVVALWREEGIPVTVVEGFGFDE